MREGPVEGVSPGRPVRFEERLPLVLVESLLHFSQQLVVGHAAQSVRESRRVAKVKRHRRAGSAHFWTTHFSVNIEWCINYTRDCSFFLVSSFRILSCRKTNTLY